MKIKQYKGPFPSSYKLQNLDADSKTQYVHIGINIPYSQPLNYDERENLANIYGLRIVQDNSNGSNFRINDNNILEFDGIANSSLTITTKRALPRETIIDIICKDIEE